MLQQSTDAASWASHFGFGAQSELVAVPAVVVEPVTSRPMAMPPQFAWTLGGAGSDDVVSEDFTGGKKYTKAAHSPVAATTSPPPSHPQDLLIAFVTQEPPKPAHHVAQHMNEHPEYHRRERHAHEAIA